MRDELGLTALRAPAASALDVENRGQVFTPDEIVRCMLRLRRNRGRVLEPACGDGAFSRQLPGCVAIEVDAAVRPPGALAIDFFAFRETEKFDSIIGNPPYVRHQDIPAGTSSLLRMAGFDRRTNLYLFFMEKCLRHLAPGGELIFITPRDFLKSTSAVHLNRRLYELGTITEAIELGDSRIFAGALPNCLIWRYELGDLTRRVRFARTGVGDDLGATLAEPNWQPRHFVECAGHLLFARDAYPLRVSDLFSVKVGAVSGDDAVYASAEHGNRAFVCSRTAQTGELRRMIYQDRHPHLEQYKERLMARRIRRFDESNWWEWGRGYHLSQRPRIYVNCRTRNPAPFFVHPCIHYDGAVLALFPHDPGADVRALAEALNGVDWSDLGFVCDGRYLFSQRGLENAPLPERFSRFLPDEATKRADAHASRADPPSEQARLL